MKLKIFLGTLLLIGFNQTILAETFNDEKGAFHFIKGKANSLRPLHKRTGICLPNPSEKFLQLKKSNQLLNHGENQGVQYYYDEVYNYLIFSVDSTSEKRVVKMSQSAVPLIWEQEFAHGITYRYEELESGGEGILFSKCIDKSSFLSVVEPVIKFIPFENWYDYNPVWNEDSTSYSPADGGVGCYYDIELDSIGYLMMNWYCGC